MPVKKRTPYGFWPSPVTAEIAAAGSRRYGSLQAADNAVYWSESRPNEKGRQTIIQATANGPAREVLPVPFSARSRVHEYGGGEFLVAGQTIYFVNDEDQQVYAFDIGRVPVRITDAPDMRFADLVLDVQQNRLLGVGEQHAPAPRGAASGRTPRNVLVSIGLSQRRQNVTEVASSHDFYASVRLSPDGQRLAFLAWDLPDMPWDSAALYLANLRRNGTLGRPRRIAGGDGCAAFQPEWSSADGHLYFVLDDTGWGQMYRWDGEKVTWAYGKRGADLSRPLWVFGTRSYAIARDGRFGTVSLTKGTPLFGVHDRKGGSATTYVQRSRTARIDDPVAFNGGFAALISSPVAMPRVMRIGPSGLKGFGAPSRAIVSPRDISVGEVVEFRENARQIAYGIYYAPTNARHQGPADSAPPAIVFVHGGPTSMADSGLKMRVQYYTSRGFAVFDVNYSGSTGFGRAYRERLDGQWGIADVADCASAARHLAHAGLADRTRIAISGGSAGGYTTLMALATTDAFAAGSCHYGVSDLRLLLEHTHKFESGYLHRLMGTKPGRWKRIFAERSPVNLIDRIRAPVILFQGLDDKVVPPEQSRLMVARLRERGLDVAYHEFAGEAHGFRKAETIVAVLEAELAFLQRVLRLGSENSGRPNSPIARSAR